MHDTKILIEELATVLRKEFEYNSRPPDETHDEFLVKCGLLTDKELLELEKKNIEKRDSYRNKLLQIYDEYCRNKSLPLQILEKYCKFDEWELEEAVSMLLYIPPKIIFWKDLKKYLYSTEEEYEDLWLISDYQELMMRMQRAIKTNNLNGQKRNLSPADTTLKETWESYYFKPIDFIQWAKKNKISLPAKMENLVKKHTKGYVDFEAQCAEYELKIKELEAKGADVEEHLKPLQRSKEKSYQKLIFLLVNKGYGLQEFNDKNAETILEDILKDAQSIRDNADLKLPFELPCDKTITEHYNNSIDTLFHQNKPSIKKTKRKPKNNLVA